MIGAKINLNGELLPDGWTVQLVGEVGEYINGYAFKPSDWHDSGVPIVRIQNLTDTKKPYNYHPGKIDEKYRVVSGDILISWSASLGTYLWRGDDAWLNQHIFKAIPDETKIERDFFYWAMVYAIDRIAKNARGSTMVHVTGKEFRESEFLLPPRSEQWKIAAVLELVERAIEQQERLLALAVELKKALLHQLFTLGLRNEAQEQTELGLIRRDWKVVPLGNCAHVQTGIAKGRKLNGEVTLTLPYLRVANVQSGFLNLAEMKTITIRERERDRYLLHDGDVVLTEGGDFDKLGRGFIWKAEIPECIHQNHIFAVRVDRSRLMPEFFAYLSQSPYGKAYFLSVAHKTTNLACINTTKLKGFPVLIPNIEEQAKIVEVLSAVDAKIQRHRVKQATLNALFRTLLYELMTARIRVSTLDL